MDSPDPNSTNNGRVGNDKSRNIEFSKDSQAVPPLEARITRIFYLNAFGHEIYPRPNGVFLESLQNSTSYVVFPQNHQTNPTLNDARSER